MAQFRLHELRGPSSTVGATLLVLTMCSACAGNVSSTDKQIQSLRDELSITQTALDRVEERLSAMEASQKASPLPAVSSANGAGLLARPDLRVVKLTPGSPGATTDVAPAEQPAGAGPKPDDADLERPVIVGEGSRLETRMVRPQPEAEAATPAPKRK